MSEIGELLLAVGFDKVSGVGVAGSEHVFITLNNQRSIFVLSVANHHEVGQQAGTVGFFHREIALMLLHDGDQNGTG